MPPSGGPLTLLRALVVDHSEPQRRRLSALLRHEGFDCSGAGDGIEALQHASVYKFDLIVTDVQMPRMGGYELIDLIGRGAFGNAPPPIIVCSDERVEILERSPWLRDCAGFVSKPVDPDQFRCAVLKAFSR
jgi:two-component system chemotaxis response regulator CheY